MKKYKKYIELLPPIDIKRVYSPDTEKSIIIRLLKKCIHKYYNNVEDTYYSKKFNMFQKDIADYSDKTNSKVKELFNEINLL